MKTTRLTPGKKVTVTRQYSDVDASEAEQLADAAIANLRGFIYCMIGLFGLVESQARPRSRTRTRAGAKPASGQRGQKASSSRSARGRK